MKASAARFLQHFPFTATQEQEGLFLQLHTFLQLPTQQAGVFILSGYAGTGKTTCLKALVEAAKEADWSVQLLAPTGRAAKIISNKTNHKAYTLHRQLYKTIESPYSGKLSFERCRNYKTHCLFIVDEASMLGVQEEDSRYNLLSDLVAHVFEQPFNKLVLVGDTAQLPPIGSSASPALQEEVYPYIFGVAACSFQLKEVIRQHKDSGILACARQLRQRLEEELPTHSLPLNHLKDVYQLPEKKLQQGMAYAYEKYGVHETLLLCATNQEALGYNQLIRKEILGRRTLLEAGDLLMVARNNYQVLPRSSRAGFLANGEFIEVVEVLEEEPLGNFTFLNLRLRLPDHPRQACFTAKVLPETLLSREAGLSQERMQELFELALRQQTPFRSRSRWIKKARKDAYLNALQVKYAYALTCHKAQGGQWKAVFLKQRFPHKEALTPEQLRWLYTATTRASKELFWIS